MRVRPDQYTPKLQGITDIIQMYRTTFHRKSLNAAVKIIDYEKIYLKINPLPNQGLTNCPILEITDLHFPFISTINSHFQTQEPAKDIVVHAGNFHACWVQFPSAAVIV